MTEDKVKRDLEKIYPMGTSIIFDYIRKIFKKRGILVESRGDRIEGIFKSVCDAYGVEKEKVLSHSRIKELIPPRRILIKRLRDEVDMTFPEIGRLLDRDHTTIMYHYYGE